MQLIHKIIIVGLMLLGTTVSSQNTEPKDWILDGNKWDSYSIGIDNSNAYSGTKSAYIKSEKIKIRGFGTLMQAAKAEQFHGKRIRLTAYVKTKDVLDWAGMWMRVDDYNIYNNSLSFDNMYERPIRGNTKWTQYEIVLDVPMNASKIVYGLLLSGTGQVWIDNVIIEEVPKDVPTTDQDGMINKPSNLDFED